MEIWSGTEGNKKIRGRRGLVWWTWWSWWGYWCPYEDHAEEKAEETECWVLWRGRWRRLIYGCQTLAWSYKIANLCLS